MASLLAHAGAFSFQNLMGGLAARAKRAEDTKPEPDEDEEEREANRKATGRAETNKERDDREEQEARAAQAPRVEKTDDPPQHYDDDGKGKKAASEDDGDEGAEEDDDEEMKKAKATGHGPAIRAARRAERLRVGRILSAARPEQIAMAAHLACNTGLSSMAAVGVLKTAPVASARSTPFDALNRRPAVRVGPDGGAAASTPGQRLVAAAQSAVKQDDDKRARRAALRR